MSVCDVDPASDELTEENFVSFLISGICTNTLEMPLSKCRSHVRLLIVVIQFRVKDIKLIITAHLVISTPHQQKKAAGI